MHPGGFVDITSFPESNQAYGTCAMWGDWDNDGDADLYVTNFSAPNRLLENQWPVVLPRFMDHARVPESSPADGAGVQWIDYNRDGWLDLFVANFTGAGHQLYRNLGHGMGFVQVLAMQLNDIDNARDAAWGDFDNDGDLDCYLVKWGTLPNFLARNDGAIPDPNAWMFSNVTIPGLMADNAPGSGACWGDFDNDGDLDLYVVNNNAPNRLWRNDGPDPMDPNGWLFTDVTTPPVVDMGPGMGACWFDFDNDGDLDLYIVNYGQANRLLRNDGGGIFTDVTHGPLGCAQLGNAVSFADYNLDGFLDLYIANEGTANKLLRNDVANGNNWLKVKLNATSSNGSAVGARVMLWTAAKGMQIREVGDMTAGTGQEDPLVHFGLGGNTLVDSLRVIWPGGIIQDTLSVAVNQVLVLTEPASSNVRPDLPMALAIERAFPNPFNPGVSIDFSTPRAGTVELSIYNPAGRLVRVLDLGSVDAGHHSIFWNGCDDQGRRLASGVYFVHLKAFGEIRTLKLSLVK
jgi:hypothetical protein